MFFSLFIHLSIYPLFHISNCLSVCHSARLSVYQSDVLSVYLVTCQSICLSICHYTASIYLFFICLFTCLSLNLSFICLF